MGSVAGKAVEVVTLIALATVLPRVMGPADYGRFAVPLTVVTIGSLALTLGGPVVLARYVPAVPEAERLALAKALGLRLARGRAVQLVVIAAVAAVGVMVVPDALRPVETALVVVALVLNTGALLALQVGLGLGRTTAWSFRYPLHNAVLVVAVLVLYPLSGTMGAIVAIVVAGATVGVFGSVVVSPLRSVSRAQVGLPDGAIRFGVHQATGAALTQFAQRGGVIATAVLAGSSVETGYAALAIGIALGATYAVLQAFTVTLPHLAADMAKPASADSNATGSAPPDSAGPRARKLQRGDDQNGAPTHPQEEVPRRLAGWMLAAIVPAAVVGVVAAGWMVPTVLGDDFSAAVPALVPAAAVVALAPPYSLGVQIAALRLRPGIATACGVAAALGFVATSVIAVPRWEAVGALSATLVGMALSCAVAVLALPGAIGGRLATASFGGALVVLGAGWLAL